MTLVRRPIRPRRLPFPSTSRLHMLLVGDPADVGAFLEGCTAAALDLPLQAVPHVDAAWDWMCRRGPYRGHDHTPAMLVIWRPERAGLLPFLRRVRGETLLRALPVVLLTEQGRHCPATEAAGVQPILYFARPESPAACAAAARELASLLPEF